jgi:hypothetical protein
MEWPELRRTAMQHYLRWNPTLLLVGHAMSAYTLRRRRETFDWINELTLTLIQAWAVHTQRQAETARRLAVETWLHRNGVITIARNQKVLPISPEKFAHN